MIRPVLLNGASPALRGAVFLAMGIGLGAFSSGGSLLSIFLFAVAAAGALLPGKRRHVYGAVCAMALGFWLGRARLACPAAESFRTVSRLDLSRPVQVTGRLADFWTASLSRRHCRMTLESVRQGNVREPLPAEAQLWVAGDRPLRWGRGDVVTATGYLRLPDVPVSPRDLASPRPLYLFSVKSALGIRLVRHTMLSVVSSPNRWLEARLRASGLSRQRVVAPISALLLGRTQDLDEGVVQNFRRGGLYHLLVIAGLHVGLLAAGLFGLLTLLGASRRRKDLILLLAVVAFAFFCGGKAPVVRASVTIAFLLFCRLLEKPVSALQAVGVSAVVVLLADPSELFSVGFFLTYGAVLGISLLTCPLAEGLRWLPANLRLTLAVAFSAQLATAPIIFWRFNLVSALAWVGTPLSIPVLVGLLALGVLILAGSAAGIPMALAAGAFAALLRLLETLAERCGSAAFLRVTPPLEAVVALLTLLVLAAVLRGRRRLVPLTLYALLFVFLAVRRGPSGPRAGFSVETLDVGQGDSILLRSGSRSFLIDGGGGFDSEAEDFGRTRLLPKLLDRGVTRLDAVLLSHPHPDHALGLFAVLREMPVGVFYRGGGQDFENFFSRLTELAHRRGVPARLLQTGAVVTWAGGTLSVLRSGGRPFKTDPVNNGSVVVIYEKEGRRALLTGDAGRPAERDILDLWTPLPRVDLVKVGHHGSRTSSSPEFLLAVCPRVALLSCGRNNRFHHPAPATMETFAALHIPVFRTDQRSDVGVVLAPRGLTLFQRGYP